MTVVKQASRPLWTYIRCSTYDYASIRLPLRTFSTTPIVHEDAQAENVTQSPVPTLDPNYVYTKREERMLIRSGVMPIGSRRRRAALQSAAQVPFEQLPYQCFQEARQVLKVDREEKLRQIADQRRRIDLLKTRPDSHGLRVQITSHERYLEKLKILADINDPIVKKKFEDGEGDMNKPIYRYLADKKWRSYKRKIIMQRIEQMHVVPDVLPNINPVMDISIHFGRRSVQPGEYVDSRISEQPPTLYTQVFDKGERLVTVVVVDSDVPNIEKDGFDYRCHFIASNIPISPTSGTIRLAKLDAESNIVVPWMPPHSHKGAPYHRLSIFIFNQEGKIDAKAVGKKTQRENFILRSFIAKQKLNPVGITMFRNQWDEGTAEVMKRAGMEGWDIEFKRKRGEKLPYKKKDGERYR